MSTDHHKTDKRIAEIEARIKREQEIHCPFCDEVYDDTDDYRCISYHGEDGPVEVECLNETCEQSFLVTENVRRTYETSAIGGKKVNEALRQALIDGKAIPIDWPLKSNETTRVET